MKHIILLFLLVSAPLMAKTPHKLTPTTPEPIVVQQEAVPMAKQRTVQEDLELRDWIVGIQTVAQDAMKRADEAEIEAKASRDQSAIAEIKAGEAQKQLVDIQAKYNGVEDERNKAIVERDTEHKGRVVAEAHVSKIKSYLGFALGGLFAFTAFYLLLRIPLPMPMGLYARIGGPVLAFGLGWLIVARFV
jgi:hypothetical protein